MRRFARWAVNHTKSAARQQFDRSMFGQAVISGLVAVILLIGVAWNLPESAIKRALLPVLAPVAQSVGLEQVWKMYAPDVIRQLEYTEVQVTMDDGTTRKWVNPSGDKLIGPFAWYHWQKLKENIPRDPAMQPDLAHWVVRELTDPSETPVRVQIIMRTEQLPPPGVRHERIVGAETLYDEHLIGRP
ncbi:hypothetical protein [Mycobacterium sp. ITM-2016-00318]|uniref:hypothetical protein n=1 Tax=Mycobacterium sp. ITM-2016-00318 TaxID=2099693 RepID=UPI0011570F3E|nr:hypothetical protein [Mycobacterium sp. ITM-2016-00318]WNG92678.1 hypothetical protein C6A82_025440 [Mycobacterium sp. ITM-2016-00318]